MMLCSNCTPRNGRARDLSAASPRPIIDGRKLSDRAGSSGGLSESLRDDFRLQSSYSIRKTLHTSTPTPVFFRIMPSLGLGRTTVVVAMALGRIGWTSTFSCPKVQTHRSPAYMTKFIKWSGWLQMIAQRKPAPRKLQGKGRTTW